MRILKDPEQLKDYTGSLIDSESLQNGAEDSESGTMKEMEARWLFENYVFERVFQEFAAYKQKEYERQKEEA